MPPIRLPQFDEMLEAIERRSHGRFSVTVGTDYELSEDAFDSPKHVFRLRRSGKACGHRTFLVIQSAYSDQELQAAFGWAADVREQLPEPETADLYMIMVIDGVADEDAARLETDDRFCRKIVLRRHEKAGDLLDRTFLASVSSEPVSSTIGDPLQASLDALGDEYSWTKQYLKSWHEILLSGKTGADLGQQLTSVIPELKADN